MPEMSLSSLANARTGSQQEHAALKHDPLLAGLRRAAKNRTTARAKVGPERRATAKKVSLDARERRKTKRRPHSNLDIKIQMKGILTSLRGDAKRELCNHFSPPPAAFSLPSNSLEVLQEVLTGSGDPSTSTYSRVPSSQLLVSQDETLVSIGLWCPPERSHQPPLKSKSKYSFPAFKV